MPPRPTDPLDAFLATAARRGAALLARLALSALVRLLALGRASVSAVYEFFGPVEIGELAAEFSAQGATADLLGRAGVRAGAGETPAALTRPTRLLPMAPQRAADYFRSLLPSLDPEPTFAADHSRRGFTLAVNTEREILSRVHAALLREVETGEAAAPTIRDLLDAAGVLPPQAGYAEMVARTNVSDAYAAGFDREIRRSAADVPGWRYAAVVDAASRPHHAERDGNLYPAGVPFLAVRGTAPSESCNCRCRPTAVGRAEWDALAPLAFAEWNPADHPRGTHGRFADAGRAVAAAHPHPGTSPDAPAGMLNPHMLAADPALRAAALLHEAWARRMNAHLGGQILKRMTEPPPALRPPEPDAPPARQAALLRRAKEIHDTAESDVLRLGPAFAPAAETVAAAHPEGRELLAFAREEAGRRLEAARASFADHVAAVGAQPRRTAVSIFRKAGVTRSDIVQVSGRAFPAAPRPGGVE
jgi:SPP1 gp7 family putative phage head morphogenesis protein